MMKLRILKSGAAFTLLEVMVALLIFLVVSATMASSFVGHLKHNTDTEVRGLAMGAAQQVLDGMRLTSPSSLPNSGTTTQSVVIGGKTFSVASTFCPVSTYCTTSANRHIQIQVSHLNKQIYETETVFTRLR